MSTSTSAIEAANPADPVQMVPGGVRQPQLHSWARRVGHDRQGIRRGSREHATDCYPVQRSEAHRLQPRPRQVPLRVATTTSQGYQEQRIRLCGHAAGDPGF